MKIRLSIFIFMLYNLIAAQETFSYYYPFDSHGSTFRTMLVEHDTILLQGYFLDTISPFLQGMAFAKVDSSGNLISYQRYFDPKGRDLTYPPLNNIIKLSDGRYLTVSISLQDDALQLIFLTRKFQVDTVFEYFGHDPTVQVNWIRGVFELSDGYLVFGSAQRLTYATDGQIFRINKQGDLLWRKWYGINNKDEAFGDVTRYSDSTFVVGSFHKPFPVTGEDKKKNIWIFEVDANGNILKEFVDPNPFSGSSGGIVIDKDKNIFYAGSSIVVDMYGQHNALGRIGMLNSDFQLQWKEDFGKNFNIQTGLVDMILLNDKVIAVGRHVDSSRTMWGTPNGFTTGWYALTTINGDSICEKSDTAQWFPSHGRAMGFFRAVDTLSSGSIITCGDGWFGENAENYKEFAWLVKIPKPPCEGFIVNNNDIPNSNDKWKIYPNPANETAIVRPFLGFFEEITSISIYDIHGRLIKNIIASSGADSLAIDLSGLQEGIYFVQSTNMKGHLTGVNKLIKN